MNKIANFLIKRPVKILLIMFAVVIAVAIGATQITLNTGNDTLISDSTDIYLENEAYQMEFGSDPIILVFDSDSLFDIETLTFMNLLQEEVKTLDGIFSMNSPVTVINQVSQMLYTQTSTGLDAMATGLTEVSGQLNQLSLSLSSNDGSDLPDLVLLQTNIGQLVNAQDQLGTGLDSMFNVLTMLDTTLEALKIDISALKVEIEADPLLVDELAAVVSIETDTNQVSNSIKQLLLGNQIQSIPPQTSLALGQLLTTLSGLSVTLNEQVAALAQLAVVLDTLSINLGDMGTNLGMIQANFNAFSPSFPTSEATLNMMIYDGIEVKDSFKGFIVDEAKLRMVIVLDGTVTDEQIDMIASKLETLVISEGMEDNVLISGKPILDRSIKSSMMESMQFMMASAVVIMIIVLSLIYKVKMRLLPIFMILLAVIATIGMMGWLSIGLTMVSMAVFPVLIGLGIDYFIQFQTRYEEERVK
ncbi:MAG: MMPL family transporter [Acholeplasmataceae bacterium]|nr:MMPL family transporter [Acholeplasmataceae bacterium]